MLNKLKGGFTLLEVMVALGILAIALIAISSSQSSSIHYVTRTFRMTSSSFLMYGVINDIEDYYQRKGFPSNNLSARDCELPRNFRNDFECTYELTGMNLTAEIVSGLVQAGYESFISSISGAGYGDSQPYESMKEHSADMGNKPNPLQNLGGMDLAKLAIFAPLFGENADEIIGMCNINIPAIIQGITGMIQFLPQIIEQVSKQTRQLTVTISWKEGPYNRRQMKVSTFIVSLPEEEVERLRQQEEMQNAMTSGAQGGGFDNTGTPPIKAPEKKTSDTKGTGR